MSAVRRWSWVAQSLVLGTGLFVALVCMAAAAGEVAVFRYQGF